MDKLDAAISDLASTIVSDVEPGDKPPLQAVVLRTDQDGTTWVSIPGGAEETPVGAMLADAEPGDIVTVDISGNRATAIGNVTAPATSVRAVEQTVEPIRAKVLRAVEDADAAKMTAKAAQEAAAAAAATGQHFWDDDSGAHVTEVTREDWEDSTSEDYHAGHNLLMNSLGILLRKALNNLASITESAIAFFDGTGNAAANVTASFGPDGFQVGRSGESHLVGDYHSLQLVDKEGNTYFHASDITGRNGEYTYTFTGDGTTTEFEAFIMFDGYVEPEDSVKIDGVPTSDYTTWTDPDDIYGMIYEFTTAPADGAVISVTIIPDSEEVKAFTLGTRASNTEIGPSSVATGIYVEASGYASFAEGWQCAASGDLAHAEGNSSIAAGGNSHAEGNSAAYGVVAHSEGSGTRANGEVSHAEGQVSIANGYCSHAEGFGSKTSSKAAHAEGEQTEASGVGSHAEGGGTKASGNYSHAEGLGTTAASAYQTVMGKYNIVDSSGTYAAIIGNGTTWSNGVPNRSNALAIKWDGTPEIAIDTNAASGTDYDLYSALTTLGWTSDVIV